jgi:hypothetical protein
MLRDAALRAAPQHEAKETSSLGLGAYAGLRTAANCGECMGSAVRVLVE